MFEKPETLVYAVMVAWPLIVLGVLMWTKSRQKAERKREPDWK